MSSPKRSGLLDLDTRIYPIDAARLSNVTYQKLTWLIHRGRLPKPGEDGKYGLGEFVVAYIRYSVDASREKARKETRRFTLFPKKEQI